MRGVERRKKRETFAINVVNDRGKMKYLASNLKYTKTAGSKGFIASK